MEDYECIIQACWDWYEETAVTYKEWTNWIGYDVQVFGSTPILTIFPDLQNNLWSRASLSTRTSTLGKPIEAVRLGKPNYRPSMIVGVIINNNFKFPEMLTIDFLHEQGVAFERKIRIAYPCKLLFCIKCNGSGHERCGNRTWAMIVSRLPLVLMRQTMVPMITMTEWSRRESTNLNLNSNSRQEEWRTVVWSKKKSLGLQNRTSKSTRTQANPISKESATSSHLAKNNIKDRGEEQSREEGEDVEYRKGNDNLEEDDALERANGNKSMVVVVNAEVVEPNKTKGDDNNDSKNISNSFVNSTTMNPSQAVPCNPFRKMPIGPIPIKPKCHNWINGFQAI